MITEPTFNGHGEYVLDTLEQRAAAMFHALRKISIAASYSGAGELHAVVREMEEIAQRMLAQLRDVQTAERIRAMQRVETVLAERKTYIDDDHDSTHVDDLDDSTRLEFLNTIVAAATGESP